MPKPLDGYPALALYIDGAWHDGAALERADVINPATEEVIARLPLAGVAELDLALAAAQRGFEAWRKVSAYERAKLLRKAAALMRERADAMARCITLDQGKPLAEARGEILGAADHVDWYAEEGRRAYGRIIPGRAPGVRQMVLREPVGPVAGFSPWNFPVSQAVRKIAGALAAGCSIIIKAPEETPGSCVEVARCFHDAGFPAGVVNVIFGVPAEVSAYLIPSPVIRKVSFTGSIRAGKLLGAMAAAHVKRSTMELGGHSPFIVFDDVDADAVAKLGAGLKYRNAGQVCVSPSRFYVHESVYDRFVDQFVGHAQSIKVGPGLSPDTQMGPLANRRRLDAIDEFVDDARTRGAKVRCGGNRIGEQGYFFQPTVLTDVPDDARVLNEEPFGPVAPIIAFREFDDVIRRANALEFGLAAYAFTQSAKTAALVAETLESGMVSINHFGLALPETPFGGVKESGHGSEGGSEGLDAYLVTKFVSQAGA